MNDTPSNSEAQGAGRPRPSTGAKSRRLLPLTVWLCSDADSSPRETSQQDRDPAGRTAAGTDAVRTCPQHQRLVGRELAAHLIDTCTREGDTVAEAFTAGETTVATAARLGRRGLACVPNYPLARYIGQRLRADLTETQLGMVGMRPCRPDQLHCGLVDHRGRVSLVIAALPSYEGNGGKPRPAAGRECPACRAEFWMLTDHKLSAFLHSAWRVLRPGGHLAVITTTRYDGGRLIDPAPRIVREASRVGFRYDQHVIALRVPVEGDALVVQSRPTDLAELRDIRSRALPPVVSVHADVCLFTKPQGAPGPGGSKAGRR